MSKQIIEFGGCRFELLTDAENDFLGLGSIHIGNAQVRSSRLPLSPTFHTFASGQAVTRLKFLGVDQQTHELRFRTRVMGAPMLKLPYRDYHLSPVFSGLDWDRVTEQELGDLDLVISRADSKVGPYRFQGFAYRYEYRSSQNPIYFLHDRASWELDGDIMGATVYSQSVCADPLVTFAGETAWTTEERNENAGYSDNSVITHAYPRWAGHQAFDYQFKDNATLIGSYTKLGLICSVLRRDPGQAELKTFDTHWFTESLSVNTPDKRIMINLDPKTPTGQRNLWTWTLDDENRRARAEIGMREVPQVPSLQMNYWVNFTYETYRKDLLPAASAAGIPLVYIDNVNRSAMTEGFPGGNMCQSHDYEPAPLLGGTERLKALVDDARQQGVRVMSWTSTAQGPTTPLVRKHAHEKGWFVRMEDGRTISGDTHTTDFFLLNMAQEAPRSQWVDGLKRIRATTGLDSYYLDMFWNVTFAPVNYENLQPATQWRQVLQALSDLQEQGIDFQSEISAFTQSRCGYHPNYQKMENLFLSYKLIFQKAGLAELWSVAEWYRVLAHQSSPALALFYDKIRIDQIWTPAHRQALTDYMKMLPLMHTRHLQDDGRSVLWHDAKGEKATLFNFERRQVPLPGKVSDITADKSLPESDSYALEPLHTYGFRLKVADV